ncbi:MAG: PP2C family protein-serine/threonine phosphatase [Anaerolineales bacterium]|nr:PP2C family protein-serine/threonine phosphatase [Anaerolineales bacterium]
MTPAKTENRPDPFFRLARWFRRDLDQFHGDERSNRVSGVLGVAYTLPMAVGGLIWLVLATDPAEFVQHWPMLLLIAGLTFLLSRLRFYFIVDLGGEGGSYGNTVGTLEGVVKWSGIFLFGLPVLWIDLFLTILFLLANRSAWSNRDSRWGLAQNLSFNITTISLLQLTTLSVYRAIGGTIPLPGLEARWLLLGLAAVSTQLILEMFLLWSGYLGYSLWAMRATLTPRLVASLPLLLFMGQGVPYLAHLFAVPLAGIYTANGLLTYLILVLAVLLAAFLARQMSRATENSRQQSIQLEKLEALGRAILTAPPDASTLPDLLAEHVPAMFTLGRMGIWIARKALLVLPGKWPDREQTPIRRWISRQVEPRAFPERIRLPWNEMAHLHQPVVTAPILDTESGDPIGGIYIELIRMGQSWERKELARLLPSLQGLAAQVASALHQARVYHRTLAHQKTAQELAMARQIQTSFLPHEVPEIPGWNLAASLEPAREMAGDFYDLIPLPNGKLGLLIADVADKGVGPALYMALSRTLVRTFAIQYVDHPERVLQSANRRILQDAGDELFVTAFYAVLDPQNGRLTYANAGHNPAWVFVPGGAEPARLRNTGMPLGVAREAAWKRVELTLPPGSLLFLYTDGAIDAQNVRGELYGELRLQDLLRSRMNLAAGDLHASLVAELRRYIGAAPQFDDITLVVLKRDGSPQ